MAVEGFEFKLLGPLEVARGGCVVPIRAAKLRVVLASLLIEAPRVVTVDQLIARLWNKHAPGGAQGTMRSYVMRLRQALGTTSATGPIMTCAEGYCVDLSGHDLDLRRFEGLVSQARTAMAEARMDRASALLCDALRLWRGDPLSNVPSDVLHRQVHPQLEDQWLLARELCTDAALAQQRYHDVIADSGELTIHYPLRERFWAQRMLALYLSGRQAEALKCYREVRDLLAEELAIDPSAELKSLHQAILENDPSLQSTCPGSANGLPEGLQVRARISRALTRSDVAGATSTATLKGSGSANVDAQRRRLVSDTVELRQTCLRIAPVRELFEREYELNMLNAHIDAVCRGSGQLVIVEGAAGIGKTQLLAAARAYAEQAGMRVLVARGSELEQEFAYGVARQLFEPAVINADKPERNNLFTGAAAQAEVLFNQVDTAEASSDISFALLHGLHWLTANLAQQPLVLIIDDLHWSDTPSLRFLAYLLPRMDGLPLLLVVALRCAEATVRQHLITQITTDPLATVLRLAPLSEGASKKLVRTILADDAEDTFCRACHAATGGNPLLLRELVNAAAVEGVEATTAGIVRLGELGPRAVKRRVALRLAQLGPSAVALSGALAILGDNANLAHVATLARLTFIDALQTGRQLAETEILHYGPPAAGEASSSMTVSFVHPLVRSAVYEGLTETVRLEGHACAARLLADCAADAERIAAHLLIIPPAGEQWVVSVLRSAANQAFVRGSTDSAMCYLERCLLEPSLEAERADVLFQLGVAAQLRNATKAAAYLASAMAAVENLDRKAAIAEILGITLFNAGRGGDASQVLLQAIQDLNKEHTDLNQRLQAILIHATLVDPDKHAFGAARVQALRSTTPDTGLGSRMLDVTIAFHDLLAGTNPDTAIALARRGLSDGILIEQAHYLVPYGCFVLIAADLDEVIPLLDEWITVAHRRGSVVALAPAKCFRGLDWLARGALAEAEDNLRDALWAVTTTNQMIGMPVVAAYLANVLMEQGKLDEAEAILNKASESKPLPQTGYWAWLVHSRAHLLLLQGRIPEALQTWLACGHRFSAHGGHNPAVIAWRSGAALALHHLGRDDEARTLASEEVALARRWAAPSALGHALRVAGLVHDDQKKLELLREATTVLARSPARLEYAKALIDVGAALQHLDHHSQSHQQLTCGVELAHICGATPLIERGNSTLRVIGARSHPRAPSGLNSLTPTERRITELAATGHSNRDIAQTLFITVNTVERYLATAHHKLGM